MAAAELRSELSAKIESALSPLLRGRDDHICIIDPPDHPNVGDCAILLGELDYLARHNRHARLSGYDVHSYSDGADKYIDQASILLLHGGGNFGDIWPSHHELRLKMIERFHHKPIIQLPQSISFDSADQLKRTKETILAHPDFTLLVRDHRSLAFAEREFECRSILCPDMAFAMAPITRLPPSADVFCLLRTDKEVAADHAAIARELQEAGFSMTQDDWLGDFRTKTERLDTRLKRMTRRHPGRMAPFRGPLLKLREAYARQRLAYGISCLSRGRVVVTDRLHAHIISSLLNIPNYAFDSYDGKISALYETWTRGRVETAVLRSPAELPDHILPQLKRD